MSRLSYIALLLYSTTSFSQNCNLSLDSLDMPTSSFLETEHYVDAVENQLKHDILNIDHVYKKDIKKIFTKRANHLISIAENGHYYGNELLLQKIDSIGQLLISSNKIRNYKNVHWLINKTANPNACCFGEGTIMLNLGLISQLKNLDQVAFVMAHELAHYHLDHVNKSILDYVEFGNSKSTKKKIKSASRNKDQGREELIALLNEKSISNAQHSRSFELETDALGYQFYINAGFPSNEALAAVKTLKEVDSGKYAAADYQNIFGDLEDVWNPDWMVSKLSGLSLVKPSEEELELFRTHPKIDQRVNQLLDLGAKEIETKLDEDWCDLNLQLDLEVLEYLYMYENKFGAFILSTQLHEKYPKNLFAKSILANCLLDIIIAREEYYFSNLVPAPNIKMSEQGFDAATFLNNISLKELKSLTKQWIEKNMPHNDHNTEAIEAVFIKQKYIQKEDVTKTLTAFEVKYPYSNFLLPINI